MAKVQSSVVISRPVADVFAFCADAESNMRKWNEAADSVVKTSDGPLGVGSTIEVSGHFGPRTLQLSQRVTAFEQNRLISVESKGRPISPTASWSFSEEAQGTRVTFRGDPNPVGPFKLLSPVFTRQAQRLWDRNMSRLKEVMESSPQ